MSKIAKFYFKSFALEKLLWQKLSLKIKLLITTEEIVFKVSVDIVIFVVLWQPYVTTSKWYTAFKLSQTILILSFLVQLHRLVMKAFIYCQSGRPAI